MNNKIKVFINQKGITLVELLATLVIVSIIGALSYSVLFQGYSNYQRIQVETQLRDEADLIMASIIKELFVVKNENIEATSACAVGNTMTLIQTPDEDTSTPEEERILIGFVGDKVEINGKLIQFYSDNVTLVPPTCDENSPTLIEELNDGREYRIKFTLKVYKGDNKHEMLFENTVQVIDDSKEVAG